MEQDPSRSRGRRLVGVGLVGALVGLLVGVVGTFVMTREELAGLASDLGDARVEADAGRANQALLTARLEVNRALDELDQRNYGLMVRSLEQASSALARVEAAPLGVSAERLDAARATLRAIREDAVATPGAQRAALLGLEAELEGLTAPAPAGTR